MIPLAFNFALIDSNASLLYLDLDLELAPSEAPPPLPARPHSITIEPSTRADPLSAPISQATASAIPDHTQKLTHASSPPTTTPTRASSSSIRSSSSSSASSSSSKGPSTYEEYLALAKTMDFEMVRAAQFAYKSGVDFAGRPVVVVCGSIPPACTPEQLFLYIIDLLDPITEVDYSLVYVVMSEGKKPAFSFLRKFYGTMSRKYKKNLKQLFVVHPSFWVRTGFQFFRPFISSKFWKKVVYVDDVRQLYQYMSPSQVKFPTYVTSQPGFLKNTNAMFGQSLEFAMAHPMNDKLEVPCLVESAINALHANGIEVEGIFRISGNSTRIKELQDAYDKGNAPNLSNEDVHTVTSLLKRYLRELPEPLIPYTIFPSLVATTTEKDAEEIKLATMQALLCELQPTSFHILDRLTQLLSKIAASSEKNKMSPSNLAIVVGPNVMYSEESLSNPTAAMSSATAIINIYTFMINKVDAVFYPGRLKNSS